MSAKPHASESASCFSLSVFHSARSASDANDVFAGAARLAGLRRRFDDPVDQPLQVLDRVGNRQLARDDPIGGSVVAPQRVNDHAAMVRRLHRFGLPFVLRILASQLEQDLVGPFEQLFVRGRDEQVNPRPLARVGLERRQDSAAGQLAQPLVPGGVELAGDQR